MEVQMAPIQERIGQLILALSQDLFEKEKMIRLALLSALAGESIFLLGPPGVAKSMIARRLKYAFVEARSFEYLMGKFSTPDEVFGPVSINKLKNEDKYERLTDKYLPGANIVFLDEIWKASPPIQNALLTVLNEKIYRNGEQEFKVDIRGLISASNELPLKGEGLEALWDRFLIRLVVGNIENELLFNQMIALPSTKGYEDPVAENLKIHSDTYFDWQSQIDAVEIPPHILGLIHHLRRSIRQRNLTADPDQLLYVSDRRWKKIAHLLRTSAFLNGRDEVNLMDCFLIADCIWDMHEQVEEAMALVMGSIAAYGYRRLINLKPLQGELEGLREEIYTATHSVEVKKKDIPKQYEDEREQSFFKVPGFFGENSAGFIRESDWEKLNAETKVYIPVFEPRGKGFRPFQNYQMLRKDPHFIVEKGRDLSLELVEIEEEIVQPKQPPAAIKDIWDGQIQLLLAECEKGIAEIENRRQIDQQHLKNHLFVESSFGAHVMDSLESTMHDLLNLKIEIQKTQHNYASIETSG